MANSKPNGKITDCMYCEGLKYHFGSPCGACDGTGKELVRKQLQKVYNVKNCLPVYYNVNTSDTIY